MQSYGGSKMRASSNLSCVELLILWLLFISLNQFKEILACNSIFDYYAHTNTAFNGTILLIKLKNEKESLAYIF